MNRPATTMAVFELVRREVQAGRPFPTVAEITERMGWRCTAMANRALAELRYAGHVKRVRDGRAYLYELAGQGEGKPCT